jgi:hypothetical protein
MSYCRWSTDSFRCDVYAYEDTGGGWTIHVASRKKDLPNVVRQPEIDREWSDSAAWSAAYRLWELNYDAAPWIELTAPSAGMSFNEPSLEAFRDRMQALRAEGLRFPDEVFEAIDDEIAERDAAP